MRLLPQAKTSPAFTSDVMRRIRQDERPVPFAWRAVRLRVSAALAMAACLAVIVTGVLAVHEHRQQLAELRVERQKLATELAEVKKIASENEPVLVLEHDDGTRVIMDLDSAVQPASLRTFD
jgi:hypothetical protein